MYIRRYTFAALLLIGAVTWFVYNFITKDTYHIEAFGIVWPALPVAAWVAIAMGLLYVATLFHMIFYSIVGSFRLRRYQKDYDHLRDAIVDAFLKKQHRNHVFKTARYALLGKIVDHTEMEPDETVESVGDEKISTVVRTVHKVERGESADLRAFNLPPGNPIVKRNVLNLYREGKLDDEEILSKPEQYGEELCRIAYEHLVIEGPLHAVEKYRNFMSFPALYTILGRINADRNTLTVPNTTLLDFIDRVPALESLDYLYLASAVADHMLPEQRIRLFETLSEKDDRALDAFLFTLFDLEMLDRAKEILESTKDDEYQLFKAFAELKSCSKHYDIKIFAAMMLQGYQPPV